ncbi:MAG: Smr/MutS family protein, partial [Firmicutes bacterium]|nr:Smr/MutS family protein [Bacillota bacterium]
ADEAVASVNRYLDDAVLTGLEFARIIHGKGTGVLRKTVQDLVKRDSRVKSYRSGMPNEGGCGVTVVYFDDRTERL